MKIAVVADKKAGHLSQCLGLRQILKNYSKDKDLFYLGKDIFFLPGFIERFITFFSEKIYLFILKLINPSVVDYKFDYVLCSGSRTAFPAYLLAKADEPGGRFTDRDIALKMEELGLGANPQKTIEVLTNSINLRNQNLNFDFRYGCCRFCLLHLPNWAPGPSVPLNMCQAILRGCAS